MVTGPSANGSTRRRYAVQIGRKPVVGDS
jgi:hypothetical protein